MITRYVEIIMKLVSIGLVIAAAGLWAGAGVDARPKYRDEQTLVGGTIWSQIIIPIGLMISKIVDESIDTFVLGYYLITGVVLLTATGIVLIIHEIRNMRRRQHRHHHHSAQSPPDLQRHHSSAHDDPFDKVYYAIGIISLFAAVFKLCEFVTIMVS